MGFFSSLKSLAAPVIGGLGGFLIGGPAGAAIGAGIGGSFAGAEAQSDAARKAAQSQAAAGDKAAQTQLEMFYQSRTDMTPWRLAGERGLEGLEGITQQYFDTLSDPSKYVESPGFNALLDRQMRNLGSSYSAMGKVQSGQYPQAAGQMVHDLTMGDYGNYLNRLLAGGNQYGSLAGLGQNVATAGGQLGQQTAANLGNIYQGQGNALAGQYINQANARTGLYSNLSNIGSNALNQYMMYQGMQGGGGYQMPADIAGADLSIPSFNINSLSHMVV